MRDGNLRVNCKGMINRGCLRKKQQREEDWGYVLRLCFKCPEKWSHSHLVNGECPNKTLQVLTVINGLEMEVLEDRREDMDDGDIEYRGE